LVQEIPKVLSALIVAALAWIVGSRITAGWDMRKKRGEFDILLANDFYSAVASFKTVAREWEALFRGKDASADRYEANVWETARAELAKRALETESKLESILLKLVTEGVGRDDLNDSEKNRRQRSLSLFRLAFRTLRESIEDSAAPPPGWGDPRLWLFNRLAGEISRIIYERSTQASWRAKAKQRAINAEDYLRLMSSRTTDFRVAADMLAPKVAAFFQQRAADRANRRRENVERELAKGKFQFVEALPVAVQSGLPASPLPAAPPVDAQATAAIEIAGDRRDAGRALEAARGLFTATPHLRFYVVLCDGPARVVVAERDAEVKEYEELKPLASQLPWKGRPTTAASLLQWGLSREAQKRLAEIATHPV
jgi:hypothetical protein